MSGNITSFADAGFAAYSASQPLYQSLNVAIAQIEKQRQILLQAMREVKAMHVKLRMDSNTNGIEDESYLRHIVTAWRSTTSSYSSIFAEMSKLTDATPSEGRSSKNGHHAVSKMHEHARAASVMSGKYLAKITPVQTPKHLKRTLEVDDEVPDRVIKRSRSRSPVHAAPHRKRSSDDLDSLPDRTTKRTRSQSYTSDEDINIVDVPRDLETQRPRKESHVDDHQRTQSSDRIDRESGRPVKRIHSRGATGQESRDQSTQNNARTSSRRSLDRDELEPGMLSEDGGVNVAATMDRFHVPGVRYEDVSAEVEARLKLKEARRKETKGEMKRKRAARDSLDQAGLREISVEYQDNHPTKYRLLSPE